jgi:hypothetical protein
MARHALGVPTNGRTFFVFLDIRLALTGINGTKYDVHIFQTAAFGLGKEPDATVSAHSYAKVPMLHAYHENTAIPRMLIVPNIKNIL